MGSFTKFSIGKRTSQEENRFWESVDINSFRIDKPTVICLGGNCTKKARDVNFICKIAQKLVGQKEKTDKNEFASGDEVDFIGIAYGSKELEYDEPTELTNEEVELIAKNLFVSLCQDENGEILTENQILKNFNQITFFSHCWGAMEVRRLCTSTIKQMKNLEIDENVIKKAMGEMFHISYSPEIFSLIPTLQVFSESDKLRKQTGTTSRILNRFIRGALQSEFEEKESNLMFKEDEKTATLVTSNLTNPFKREDGSLVKYDEHSIKVIDRDDNWLASTKGITQNGDKISQVVGYTLADCVARSIQDRNSNEHISKPSIDEVVTNGKDILTGTQNPYIDQIIQKISLLNHTPEINDLSQ